MLERFLADLERIRTTPEALQRHDRAIVITDRESSASRLVEVAMTVSARRPLGANEMWYVHVYASASPAPGERSAWSFPVDRVAPVGDERRGVVTIIGVLEPGAGVAVMLDDALVEPTGPLRPLVRGVRWRG